LSCSALGSIIRPNHHPKGNVQRFPGKKREKPKYFGRKMEGFLKGGGCF
jgi:hypothetical protein